MLYLLQNERSPLAIQEYALRSFLEAYPQEAEAPAGGILETMALNGNISKEVRQKMLNTFVTDAGVLQDLLLLTNEDHVMETRFKKIKISALNNGDA